MWRDGIGWDMGGEMGAGRCEGGAGGMGFGRRDRTGKKAGWVSGEKVERGDGWTPRWEGRTDEKMPGTKKARC